VADIYGQLVSAQAENLASDPAGVPRGRVYYDTTGNLLKYRDDSAWRTLVTTATSLANPMTTTGDLIYSSDGSGTAARLAIGTASQVLVGGTTPAWGAVPAAALPAATSSAAGSVSYENTSVSQTLAYTGVKSDNATWHFSRVGRVVTAMMDSVNITTTGAGQFNFAAAAIPSGYRPLTTASNDIRLPISINDAGTNTVGILVIGDDGSATIYANAAFGGWGSGINAIVRSFSVSYLSA
jgi:hypothetical protein